MIQIYMANKFNRLSLDSSKRVEICKNKRVETIWNSIDCSDCTRNIL